MAKHKTSESKLIEVDEIPERFKDKVKPGELFYIRSEVNQTFEAKIEGYKYFGFGEGGFYYVKQ